MSFSSPLVLIALLAIPALIAWYVAPAAQPYTGRRGVRRARADRFGRAQAPRLAPSRPDDRVRARHRRPDRRRGRPAAHQGGADHQRGDHAGQRHQQLDERDRRAPVPAGGSQAGGVAVRRRRPELGARRPDAVRPPAGRAAVADDRSRAHPGSDRRAASRRRRHRDRRDDHHRAARADDAEDGRRQASARARSCSCPTAPRTSAPARWRSRAPGQDRPHPDLHDRARHQPAGRSRSSAASRR